METISEYTDRIINESINKQIINMKKAFKKPNLNLLKAIKHIQSKGATLERYCLSAEAYSFALDPGRGIVLGKSFHIETKNVFEKNFILVHNNQFTLYLR